MIMEKTQILSKLIKHSRINYETGCFLWKGASANGYGYLYAHDKNFRTHRLSAWIFKDMPLNSKMNVNHQRHCPNRNCWSPSHIYVGTQEQNIQDSIDLKTHYTCSENNHIQSNQCIYGHELTPENTYIYKNINGSISRRCRECQRLNDKRHRDLNKFYES